MQSFDTPGVELVRRIVGTALQAAEPTCGAAIEGIRNVVAAVVALAIVMGAATTLDREAVGTPVDDPIAVSGSAKTSVRNMMFPNDLCVMLQVTDEAITNILIRRG
jgi:hypothetical protein